MPGTDPASTPADVLKEDNHEPLKEALALWQDQGPREEHQDPGKKEHLQFWDSDEIETLDTYKGRVLLEPENLGSFAQTVHSALFLLSWVRNVHSFLLADLCFAPYPAPVLIFLPHFIVVASSVVTCNFAKKGIYHGRPHAF